MNKIKTIAAVFAVVILASCGGKKKGETTSLKQVKPVNTQVQGYLSDYLEVVDGSYEATRDQAMIFSWVVKVKVKAKKPMTGTDYSLKDGNNGPLKLDFYDDKQTPITGFDNLQSSFQDDSKLMDILSKGQGETWVTFSKFHTSSGKAEEYPENTAYFSISSEKREETASGGSSAGTTELTSADADKFLDAYEDIIDRYISMGKEMKSGSNPVTVAQDMAGLMEDYKKMDEQLKQKKSNLTPEQAKRVMKINAKMAKAMSEK